MGNNMSDRYTVTVYVAAPGTPLTDPSEHGATSGPGHMFYVTDNGHNQPQSHGFAPITHGQIDGPGEINHKDKDNYKDPHYSRTMEIGKEQYDKLNAYGNQAAQHGFDTYYKDARHNCVDFTWAALDSAGIKSHAPHALRPNENIDAVKSIAPPIPNSPLNTEHTNPMPKQNFKQWLLSENEKQRAPTEVTSSLPVNASRKEMTDNILAAFKSSDPSAITTAMHAARNTNAGQDMLQQANQAAVANDVQHAAQQGQNQPVPQRVQGPVMKMG